MSIPKSILGAVSHLGSILFLNSLLIGFTSTSVIAQVSSPPAPPTPQLNEPANLSPIQEPANTTTSQSLELLPVGFVVSDRLLIQSTLIMGRENGTEAVNFESWLLPIEDVFQVLQIQSTVLDDGFWELRSPGFVIRLDPNEITQDPELGQAISIADIRRLFDLPVEFDIAAYAIRFTPPWDNGRRRRQAQQLPVITDGLPLAHSENFVVSTLGQRIEASRTNGNNNNQGQLTSIGTVGGGSWFARLNQADLFDSSTWNLAEMQYFRQSDAIDYAVGSQPTFWQSQSGSQFWGFTTIRRFGYTPLFSAGSGGFSPTQRLKTDGSGQTISGEAPPNTLVQLTEGFQDNVVAEVLVDSSGIYRFEEVSANGSRYEVLLYPDGQLTAEPEVRAATFSRLSGSLAAGDAALVASVGAGRTPSSAASLLGNFEDFRGGVAYRYGLSNELTLGIGTLYDESLLGLGELFYEPAGMPVRLSASVLGGADDLDIKTALTYQPSNSLLFALNADSLSSRLRATWQVFPGLRFNVGGNTRENVFNMGTALAFRQGDFNINSNLEYTTENNFRWRLMSRLHQAEFRSIGNELSTNNELIYKLSKGRDRTQGHFLRLGYETQRNRSHLATTSWRYRSANRARDGRYLWELDLGYGIGSQGQGMTAAMSMAVFPGLILRARYEGISAFSDDASYRIELVPFANTQGLFLSEDSRYNNMRQQGGLWVQPFTDRNGNGERDQDEPLYLENSDLLLVLNNNPVRDSQIETHDNGIFIRLDPGIHRLDLDPAGYPIDQRPLRSAYAVDVVPGSYTPLSIPLTPSHTVAGRVLNANGEPLGGVRVEATADNNPEQRSISVTNGAGIFYLEGLKPGAYQLLTNGQAAQPTEHINLTEHSDPIVEVTLEMIDSSDRP